MIAGLFVVVVVIAALIAIVRCAAYHLDSLITDYFIGLHMYDEIAGVLDDMLLFSETDQMKEILEKAKKISSADQQPEKTQE